MTSICGRIGSPVVVIGYGYEGNRVRKSIEILPVELQLIVVQKANAAAHLLALLRQIVHAPDSDAGIENPQVLAAQFVLPSYEFA